MWIVIQCFLSCRLWRCASAFTPSPEMHRFAWLSMYTGLHGESIAYRSAVYFPAHRSPLRRKQALPMHVRPRTRTLTAVGQMSIWPPRASSQGRQVWSKLLTFVGGVLVCVRDTMHCLTLSMWRSCTGSKYVYVYTVGQRLAFLVEGRSALAGASMPMQQEYAQVSL